MKQLILQIFTSSSFRNKLRHVVIDRLAIAKSKLLFSFKKQTFSKKHRSDIPPKNRKDAAYSWEYNSSIKLNGNIYANRLAEFSQDSYSNGFCDSDFKYEILNLQSAVQYTDGATHRSIFNQNSTIITNASSKNGRLRPPTVLPIEPKIHIPGLSANLFGNVAMANGNYSHWLIDGLSRYFLIERFFDMETIDHFVVPHINLPFHREMLESLGITKNKIIELSPMMVHKFDQLICTSAPRGISSSVTPGWVIDSYRKRILPQISDKKGNRIYVSRKDSAIRQLANEDELVEKLTHYDFKTVVLSEYSFLEKAELFNNADVIVGLAGAGFANFMFCKENTRILEIFPPDFFHYTFTSICSYLELSHEHLVLETNHTTKEKNPYLGNQSIDIGRLTLQLEKLLS